MYLIKQLKLSAQLIVLTVLTMMQQHHLMAAALSAPN